MYINKVRGPNDEPISINEYTDKRSKYDVGGRLPIPSISLGPSVSGKHRFMSYSDIRPI